MSGAVAFVHATRAGRVVFGSGTLCCVPDELAALGVVRALVLSTPGRAVAARRLADGLGGRAAGVFAEAAMHTPVDVTARALDALAVCRADGVVALGGGSTTGLAKALALRTDVPQLVIPVTYAGSEMTDILGETDASGKRTQRSPKVLPETVVYDVDLTLSLPAKLSVTSGANAMAHAVEALYAPDATPVTAAIAAEGLAWLARALPRIVAAPRDAHARAGALAGAWMCGTVLGATTMGLHHKLCHALGGLFGLPHAETHAVVLPYVVAFNAPAARAGVDRALGALGADGARTLRDALAAWGAPGALRDLGMPAEGIDAVAEAATRSPYANPRRVERDALRALLARAWAGEAPA